jgi:hypothetical protein
MEAAKAATNRSFVYLQMAKESLLADPLAAKGVEENAALMMRVSEAKARGGRGEAPAPPPDLMERLRGGTVAEAVAAGRLEQWRMYGVLAYADVDRVDTWAHHWSKPIARQAEAARFLATQRARGGDEHGLKVMSGLAIGLDEHGLKVMSGLAIGFYEQAAERETAAAVKKQYKQLRTHMEASPCAQT